MDKDAALSFSKNGSVAICQANWTSACAAMLSPLTKKSLLPAVQHVTIDGSAIVRMDSVGAWFLQSFIQLCKEHNVDVTLQGFDVKHRSLLEMVKQRFDEVKNLPCEKIKRSSWLEIIGRNSTNGFGILWLYWVLLVNCFSCLREIY